VKDGNFTLTIGEKEVNVTAGERINYTYKIIYRLEDVLYVEAPSPVLHLCGTQTSKWMFLRMAGGPGPSVSDCCCGGCGAELPSEFLTFVRLAEM